MRIVRTREHTARRVEHVQATTRTVRHDGGRASGALELSPTPPRAAQYARVSAPRARVDRLRGRSGGVGGRDGGERRGEAMEGVRARVVGVRVREAREGWCTMLGERDGRGGGRIDGRQGRE